jgi:cell division protein FtsI (penicillin-binding protein 3)
VVAGRSRVITDDAGRNNGLLSFTKVIVKSSNIGAVKIGFRVGTERLSRFVGLYGFGSQVSPDFPSENAGIVWSPEKWTESALASVSMGYQIAVTPLQMIAAVGAVANGGQYVEPRVVPRGVPQRRPLPGTPKVVRRAVSLDTASASDLDHGRGRHRRHRETRAHRRLLRRRQDRHRRRN